MPFGRKSSERRLADSINRVVETTFVLWTSLINRAGVEDVIRRKTGRAAVSLANASARVSTAVERDRKESYKRGVSMAFDERLLEQFYREAVLFTDKQLERPELGAYLARLDTDSVAAAQEAFEVADDAVLSLAIHRRSFCAGASIAWSRQGQDDTPESRGEFELLVLADVLNAVDELHEQGELWAPLKVFSERDVLAVQRTLAEFCWEANGMVMLEWPVEDGAETVPASVPQQHVAADEPEPVAAGATKVCPDCAETIKADARVCRFCGYRFAPPPSSPAN